MATIDVVADRLIGEAAYRDRVTGRRSTFVRFGALSVVLALVAACASPEAPPVAATPTVTPPAATTAPATLLPTASPAPTARPTFAPGLYFPRPAVGRPGGVLEMLGGKLPARVEITGVGYDVSADVAISGDNDTIVLAGADGSVRRLLVRGLYGIVRPSLSPDGKQAAVQATETPIAPGVQVEFLSSVYVVDLVMGTWRRLADVPQGPSTQSELPVWFPSGDRVAYWTTENECLVIRVRDVTTAKDVLIIRNSGTSGWYRPRPGILDGPRFHSAVSPDSSRILIAGQLQVYDARTGALVADVRDAASRGLAAAGFKPDTRFPGQANAGTFPLAGAISPDLRTIVFDGAVEKDGAFGVVLAQIGMDGSDFKILTGPITVDPQWSNGHNFSQVLPRWR